MELSEITPEFIIQSNSQLCQTMPKSKKRGGPHPKNTKQKRQDEVYKLHFEYGYSARKIASLMKINRNTINSDISYLYDKATEGKEHFDNEIYIHATLHRLDIQRSRIREKIDHADDSKEIIALERLLLDIDTRMISVNQKLAESTRRMWDMTVDSINQFFADKKEDQRYISLFDKISVSTNAQKKIENIIQQYRKKVRTM